MIVGESIALRRIAATVALGSLLLPFAGCKRDPNVQKQKYLESGIRFEKDGKLREAGIQFSNAIRIDRNFSRAHYELAKTYLLLGSRMAAYQELMRTVELDPANTQARVDLGTLLLAGGVPDRANDQAKAVLAQDTNNAAGYALMAQVNEAKGQHAEALSNIQHALSLQPNNSQFYATLAQLQAADPKDASEVMTNLQKAVALDPKNSAAHLSLGRAMERSGNKAGAEQQFQAAVASDPNNVEPRRELAVFYMRAGDNGKAADVLYKAALDLPEDERAADLLSDFYLTQHEPGKSVQAYAQLTQQHRSSVPLKVAYAKALMVTGDTGKAQGILDDLNKTSKNNPQVELLTSLLEVKNHKVDDAFTLLQKGVKNSPDNVQLLVMLGKVATLKGDATTEESAYHQAATLDPANMDAQSGLAEIATHRGDWSLLAQVANNTIALHPDLAAAYLWRGSAEANQKQYDQAEADFKTAMKNDPGNPQSYTELGLLRMVQGQPQAAVPLLQKAVDMDPNAIQALTYLMRIDINDKQPARALDRLNKQITRSPNNTALYDMLAIFNLSNKDFAGANAAAQHAMHVNPADETAVQAFAQAQVGLGHLDQAEGIWTKWAQAHPTDVKAQLVLGTLAEAAGDVDKAESYYKRALVLSPQQPVAANNLAYLTVENGGNVDVALTLAQTARRAMPDSSTTADTLAWVYYHKGAYASALDLLQDAAKSDSTNASIQYHLGMTFAAMGDKTNAATHLKTAVSLAPSGKVNVEAQQALAKLG